MKTFILSALMISCAMRLAYSAGVAELIKQGDAFETHLETEKALAVYLQAGKTDPNNAEVLRRIAQEYGEMMNANRTDDENRDFGRKALGYAQRAVEADPKNAKAQLAVAVCYGRVAPLLDNKTKIAYSREVKEHVEKSIDLNPDDDLAYCVLGVWNYNIANLNPILRTVAKLIYGDIPDASYDVAVTDFKKAIALNPNRLANHVELGRTYAAMGKKAEAAEELKRGLAMPDRDKDDPDTKNRARQALAKL